MANQVAGTGTENRTRTVSDQNVSPANPGAGSVSAQTAAGPSGDIGAEVKRESEPKESKPTKMPVGDGRGARNLSENRITVPGVWPQRSYRALKDVDLEDQNLFADADLSLEKDMLTIEAGDREKAQRAASNFIAVSGGDFEMTENYEVDESGTWHITIRRKEN